MSVAVYVECDACDDAVLCMFNGAGVDLEAFRSMLKDYRGWSVGVTVRGDDSVDLCRPCALRLWRSEHGQTVRDRVISLQQQEGEAL